MAEAALQRVADQRPVLMKRDPVLHKYGIQAFKPRIGKGLAIKVPPLIVSGYNMDFDGDAVSLYTPVTPQAVEDARKMMPSANLLHPATGKPVYTPSNEMSLGLYRMTKIAPGPGDRNFASTEEALAAHARGELAWDNIKIKGKPTTVGRVRLYHSLPAGMRKDEMLYDPEHLWNAKYTTGVLKDLALKEPQSYAAASQKLMELGSQHVYDNAFSLSVNDFVPDKQAREAGFSWAKSQISKLPTGLKPKEREQRESEVWMRAGEVMEKEHWAKQPERNQTLAQMVVAGVKPNKTQYNQLLLSPILMTGIKGRVIPSVQTKQMVNTVADAVVAKKDCGTTDGVAMSVDHPDVVGRYLAKPVGPAHLHGGDLVTGSIVDHLRKAKVQSVIVRSPLKCRLPQGVCQKCYGHGPEGHPPEIGENIGVIAGQALGERSTQMFMKAFHMGGAAQKGGGASAVSQFDRVVQVLRMPQSIPNAAVLSDLPGKVSRVRADPAGGHRVTISGPGDRVAEHHVPGTLGLAPDIRVGAHISAGQPLSTGAVNMHDLLRTAGLDHVQNQITNELDDIYRSEGIRRRNIEVVARGVTNLGIVDDPGSHPTWRRGDSVPMSAIHSWNDQKPAKAAKAAPILKGVGFAPLDMTEDWMAKLHHERMKDALVDAALEGHRANVSGYNPFSALAFNPDFGQGISGVPGTY